MATRKKTDSGAAPKKRARSANTKTIKRKYTKRAPKKDTSVAPPLEEVAEVKSESVQLGEAPLTRIAPRLPLVPQLPKHMVVDGQLVPVNGIAPIDQPPPAAPSQPAVEAQPSPPPPPPPVVQPAPTATDAREQARIERLQRRQRERTNGNGVAGNGVVVAPQPKLPIPPKPEEEETPQSMPNDQQLANLAAKVLPFTPPPEPHKNVVVPVRQESHDDVSVDIPELFKFKIQVFESRMRDLAAPIRAELKAQAENWLREAIVAALNQNPDYQEAKAQTESCVNELLGQLNPQLPDGYAVVLISAKEGKAVCRYAPDQAGKRFKID